MIRRPVTLCLFGALALLAGSLGQVLGQEEGPPAATRIDVGDMVQVTVFEGAAGLQPGNFVTLPSQAINCAGAFAVPFAGDINAAGRTLPEIEREIEQRLATRAIEPRIVVTLLARNAAPCAL
jgi:polysaccharide biosynthesis/export protein